MAQWPDGVWPGSTSFSNFWYNLASRTPDPSEVWASPLLHISSHPPVYFHLFSIIAKVKDVWLTFCLKHLTTETLSLFAQLASCSITNGVAVPRFNAESQLLCMGPWFALRIPYAFLLLHFWTVSAECLWLVIHKAPCLLVGCDVAGLAAPASTHGVRFTHAKCKAQSGGFSETWRKFTWCKLHA